MGKRKATGEAAVEKVPLSSLKRTRRGKHRALMQQVLKELIGLSTDSAVKVPLGVYSAKELRAAVVRVASSHNIQISSISRIRCLFGQNNQRTRSGEPRRSAVNLCLIEQGPPDGLLSPRAYPTRLPCPSSGWIRSSCLLEAKGLSDHWRMLFGTTRCGATRCRLKPTLPGW